MEKTTVGTLLYMVDDKLPKYIQKIVSSMYAKGIIKTNNQIYVYSPYWDRYDNLLNLDCHIWMMEFIAYNYKNEVLFMDILHDILNFAGMEKVQELCEKSEDHMRYIDYRERKYIISTLGKSATIQKMEVKSVEDKRG